MPMSWTGWNALTAALLGLAALTVPIFNLTVDPYGVFGTAWRRDSYTMNERYLKTEHVLSNPKRYNAFLIGSSVMGAFDPAVANSLRPDLRFYNLSFLGGTPYEALATLRTLSRHGVEIREVVMGIDIYAFRQRVDTNRPDRRLHPLVSGVNRISWYADYLFAPSLRPGLTRLEHNLSSQPEFIRFDIEGGGRYLLVRNDLALHKDPDAYVRANLKPPPSRGKGRLTVIDGALHDLARLDRWLRSAGVRVHYFIHPVHRHVLDTYTPESLDRLKEQVFRITGTIPDYTREMSMTQGTGLYYDLNHYTPRLATRVMHDILPAAGGVMSTNGKLPGQTG